MYCLQYIDVQQEDLEKEGFLLFVNFQRAQNAVVVRESVIILGLVHLNPFEQFNCFKI